MTNYIDYDINELILNKDTKYLFHGSVKELAKLKPMQAHDSLDTSSNIDTAIFLSSDFLGAVPYAFKDKIKEISKGLAWSFSIPSNYSQVKMIMKNVRIDENIEGYVYVFNKTDEMKNDPSGSTQWKSYKELTPLFVVKVKYKDYSKYFKLEN